MFIIVFYSDLNAKAQGPYDTKENIQSDHGLKFRSAQELVHDGTIGDDSVEDDADNERDLYTDEDTYTK